MRQVLATWLLSDARLYLYWNRMNLPVHTLIQTHACIPAGSGCWESTHHCGIKRNLEKILKSLSVATWSPEVRETSFIRLFLCCLREAVQLVWEHIQSSPVSWDGGGEEINSCRRSEHVSIMFRDALAWVHHLNTFIYVKNSESAEVVFCMRMLRIQIIIW